MKSIFFNCFILLFLTVCCFVTPNQAQTNFQSTPQGDCPLAPTSSPAAPSYQPTLSQIVKSGDGNGANDVLSLVVQSSRQYAWTSLTFESASTTYCDFNSSTASGALWAAGYVDSNNCTVYYHSNQLKLVQALFQCFQSSLTQNQVIYTAVVRATTSQARSDGRDTYTRTITTALRLQIRMPRAINLTSLPVYAYSPMDFLNGSQIIVSEIISAFFDPSTWMVNVQMLTVLPYPYRMEEEGAIMTSSGGFNMTDLVWGNELTKGDGTLNRKGRMQLSDFSLSATDCEEAGTPCMQVWNFTIYHPTATPCTLSVNSSLQMMVYCADSYPGNCTLSGFPQMGPIMFFNLTFEDLCAEFLEGGSITGQLRVYNDNSYTIQNRNYLQGQTMYFQTDLTVLIGTSISHTKVVAVYVTSPGQTITMYSGDSRVSINDSALTGVPSRCRFQFVVAPNVINFANEGPLTVEVGALLDVSYTHVNNNQRKHALLRVGGASQKHSQHIATVSATDSASNEMELEAYLKDVSRVTAVVSVARTSSSLKNSKASSSSSSQLPLMVGIACAAAALTVFIVVLAIRATKKKEVQSISAPPSKESS